MVVVSLLVALLPESSPLPLPKIVVIDLVVVCLSRVPSLSGIVVVVVVVNEQSLNRLLIVS